MAFSRSSQKMPAFRRQISGQRAPSIPMSSLGLQDMLAVVQMGRFRHRKKVFENARRAHASTHQ
ncbi:hypothetical protein BCAR13_280008 [Paraburkholderia caribensis]|nr:hypothetical protein BCAR13_280008 [Paraburkholderia caribensis]